MKFKTNLLLVFFFTFSSVSNAMYQVNIKRLDLNVGDVENYSYKPKREVCKKALSTLGINENILDSSNDRSGGFGTVCFTNNYAIKRAQDYSKTELNSVLTIRNQFSMNPPVGFSVCIPDGLISLYYNGHQMNYNIQVSKKINSVKNMSNVVQNAINMQDELSLNIMKSFGKSFGEFQANKIIGTSCLYQHGDLNPNNILITFCSANGEASFTLIDISDFKKYKPACADLVYFIYTSSAFANNLSPNFIAGMEKFIKSIFIGYLGGFKEQDCSNIKRIYNANNIVLDGPLAKAKPSIKYLIRNEGKSHIFEPMQRDIFNEIYNAYFHPWKLRAFSRLPVAYAPGLLDYSIIPQDFDPFAYFALNLDLEGYIQRENMSTNNKVRFATKHYIENGRTEGRSYTVPKDFDSLTYLYLNPDLNENAQQLHEIDRIAYAKWHYLHYGRTEGRSYTVPKDFDPLTYLYLNPDLNAYVQLRSESEKMSYAKWHYLHHGRTEGRSYAMPKDFDPLTYLYLNHDLNANAQQLNEVDKITYAKWHYLHHGRTEGRSYAMPKDFDPLTYLYLHSDLEEYAELTFECESKKIEYAKWHYLHHGRTEGRSYTMPEGFNPLAYLHLNPDLEINVQRMSEGEKKAYAKWHYLHHGINEGRVYL